MIHRIDHYTLRVHPAGLESLRRFYCDVIGLVEGARPAFSFPGHWLYASERPIVHLAGTAPGDPPPPVGRNDHHGLDHISLLSTGLAEARERLARAGLEWREAAVPGAPLHQLFVLDPTGVKIELTFDADELARAGPPARAVAA